MSARLVCCSRCRRFRPCLGAGPAAPWGKGQERAMVLGEGPGWEEDQRGIPFIGTSGRELRYRYMQAAGLVPEDCYISNAIKCRQGKKGGDDPEWEEIEACALHHLPGELRAIRPDYIVTLGANALRLVDPDRRLEMCHGRPFQGRLYGWEGTVFPIYHPAAGLHQSEYMILLDQDFRDLWLWRHGRLTWPEDQYPDPKYELIRTREQLGRELAGAEGVWEMAIDTETDDHITDQWGRPLGKFWCLTFSHRPGEASMILAEDAELVGMYRRWLMDRPGLMVLYHNWLFDEPVLAQVGISTPHWTDTMIETYGLGGLAPIGLKPLAWRLCGMEMQDYDDLVGPYSLDMAVGWLERAARMVIPGYVEALPWKPGGRRCSGGKAYGGKHPSTPVVYTEPTDQICEQCGKVLPAPKMERDKQGKQFPWDRARRVLDDTLDKKANPLVRWAAIPKEEREPLEQALGPMPRASITQVPIKEAVWYACRDADATLRAKPVLRAMASKQARTVRKGA